MLTTLTSAHTNLLLFLEEFAGGEDLATSAHSIFFGKVTPPSRTIEKDMKGMTRD